MALKSADPTPTMIIDNGNPEADTIASLVWGISVIMPSVIINKIKYSDPSRFVAANLKIYFLFINHQLFSKSFEKLAQVFKNF